MYAELTVDGCVLTLPSQIELVTDGYRRFDDTYEASSTLTVCDALPAIELESFVNMKDDDELDKSSNLVVSNYDKLKNHFIDKSLEQPQTGFSKKYFVSLGLNVKDVNALINELIKLKVLKYSNSNRGILVYS